MTIVLIPFVSLSVGQPKILKQFLQQSSNSVSQEELFAKNATFFKHKYTDPSYFGMEYDPKLDKYMNTRQHENQSCYYDLVKATLLSIHLSNRSDDPLSKVEDLSPVLPEAERNLHSHVEEIRLRNLFCEMNFQEYKWHYENMDIRQERRVSLADMKLLQKGNIQT